MSINISSRVRLPLAFTIERWAGLGFMITIPPFMHPIGSTRRTRTSNVAVFFIHHISLELFGSQLGGFCFFIFTLHITSHPSKVFIYDCGFSISLCSYDERMSTGYQISTSVLPLGKSSHINHGGLDKIAHASFVRCWSLSSALRRYATI